MDGIQDDIQDLGVDLGLVNDPNADAHPMVDEMYLAAEMEKVDKSWPAILKQTFVLAKSAFTICITLHAAYKWRKTKLPMGIPA